MFLSNPIDAPIGVVNYLRRQLKINQSVRLSRYMERSPTHREHADKIQRYYGYKDFTDQPEHFQLVHWLYT